ncbi:putative alpha-xylosidase [Mariannaea sp. PMI_226]|nr:putative alpha-xylosidase [Mariannaea sp. PMI_226]
MKRLIMDKYTFPHDAVANPHSVVSGPTYRFTVINDVVLRYEWAEDGVFEDRPSTFVINRNFPTPSFNCKEDKHKLQIITHSYHLTYNKHRFTSDGLVVKFSHGGEWHYGDMPQENLGGTVRTLDGVDGRCEVGAGILSRLGFTAHDDSNSVLFGKDNFMAPRRPGDDRIDGYLFCYGHDFKKAIKAFYSISGSQPCIPRWALGNWWSRYYRYNADEYITLMDKFNARHIPLSVAVVDMDWHLSGWTGYTWNKKLFPNPEAFAQELHDRRLQMSLNDHPHQGIRSYEEQYEAMAKALGHDTTGKSTIPFDCADPNFMHAFFNTLHRSLERKGCDFWWIDWQQGTESNMPGLDPLWVLNHFQYLDQGQVNPNSEPILFSRFAGPGSHRYPLGFSGDTISTWASLQFQPEFTATASNIGYGWWSHDIGGHISGYRDDELTTRWVQLGVFSPILRLHSSKNKWHSKEPWSYRPEYSAVMEKALRLRHQLVPYLFTAHIAVSESSLPLISPLYWDFPTRDEAYRYPNEFFFGPSLVVAPIVHPRDRRTALAEVKLWVPPHRQVDIMTGLVYDGDRETVMYRSLERLPILASEGSIIPLDAKGVPQNGCANPGEFEVLVVVGRNAKFTILEDVRDDKPEKGARVGFRKYRSIKVDYDQASGRLKTVACGKKWVFRFLSLRRSCSEVSVLVDDSPSPEAAVTVLSEGHSMLSTLSSTTAVIIHSDLSPDSTITVDLGPDPQLDILDHTETMYNLIHDFQIDFGVKDRVWTIISGERPAKAKVAELLSLDLDQEIVGPFIELISADSRGPQS